ncbi:MAG: hypothetical protein ACRDQB_05315, partial [Thermocrispum sp.]
PWDDVAGGGEPERPSLVAMQKVAPSPVSAEARLVSGPWGTRIEGVCRYADKPGGSDKRYDYALYVVDTYGRRIRLSSWTAGPGETYRFTGSTKVSRDHVASAEIWGVYGGQEIRLLTLP